MQRITALACATLVLGTVLAPPGSAADSRLTVGTGFDYTVGKYGGATATDIYYVPVGAKLEWQRWTGKVTVPWISITGPGNVVGGGDFVVIGQGRNAERRTASGLGDIVASLSYGLIDGTNGFYLDAVGKVKFGTADDSKGLGTGKNDYALQLDGSQTIGRVSVLGTVGYRVMGDPPGVDLRNVWFGTAGAAYRFGSTLSAGGLFDLRQATTPGTASLREATVYLSHTPSQGLRATVYVLHGFSDGSADWGGGAAVGYAF